MQTMSYEDARIVALHWCWRRDNQFEALLRQGAYWVLDYTTPSGRVRTKKIAIVPTWTS